MLEDPSAQPWLDLILTELKQDPGKYNEIADPKTPKVRDFEDIWSGKLLQVSNSALNFKTRITAVDGRDYTGQHGTLAILQPHRKHNGIRLPVQPYKTAVS